MLSWPVNFASKNVYVDIRFLDADPGAALHPFKTVTTHAFLVRRTTAELTSEKVLNFLGNKCVSCCRKNINWPERASEAILKKNNNWMCRRTAWIPLPFLSISFCVNGRVCFCGLTSKGVTFTTFRGAYTKTVFLELRPYAGVHLAPWVGLPQPAKQPHKCETPSWRPRGSGRKQGVANSFVWQCGHVSVRLACFSALCAQMSSLTQSRAPHLRGPVLEHKTHESQCVCAGVFKELRERWIKQFYQVVCSQFSVDCVNILHAPFVHCTL